jgi:thymidine kinase
MKALKNLATERVELSAKCAVCQQEAHYTYRTIDSTDLVLVGHNDTYESRCETHWNAGMANRITN